MFFFFFPVNTDAPVYHFPWATLSLILANLVAFAAGISGLIDVDQWILNYGHISPVEWVTSNFLHEGMAHLLGNMVVLWGLGLIVEGKIGWRRFYAVFFVIAVSECAIEQVCMLGAEGGSLGASSAIFGLTAIALIWAPRNEIIFTYVFWIFFFVRAGFFELTVLTYSLVAIAIEMLIFIYDGFHIGSAAIHLLGGVVGYGVGVFMLRRNLVDCEGWDLFSVMKGTHGRIIGDPSKMEGLLAGGANKKRKRKRKKSRILTDSTAELPIDLEATNGGLSRTEQARRKILRHIADGKPRAALAELQRQQHHNPEFRLERGPLRKLAGGLIEHEQWNEAVALLEEYLERFDADTDPVRMQLAILLMQKQRRPRAALKVLEPIDRGHLSTKLQERLRVIEQEANDLIESGVIELSGQAFSSD